ncbi:D-alanyl-D-alanine carboxypeptidase [Streptomyces sp. SS162]|uniref:D-alanyl-D-alanine carboxypeptidase n=1 Tax=Streptomyces sp. SS162 TaxID=3108484 RepID=UPI002F3FD8B5
MAGESPDKSEQRRSPGETAAGGRDPRLAALGDAPQAGVDQPTAVFRAPKPPSEPDADATAEAGATAGADTATDTAEPPSAKPSLVAQRPAPAPPRTRDADGDADDDEGQGEDGGAGGPDAGESKGPERPEGSAGPKAAEAARGSEAPAPARKPGGSGGSEAPEASGAEAPPARTARASGDSGTEKGEAVASGGPRRTDAEPASDRAAGARPRSEAQQSGNESGSGDESGAEPVTGSGADDEAPGEPGSEDRPVDQPTAVFQAFGKRGEPARAVDQPTTALKALPDESGSKPSGRKPAPKWAAGSDDDGDTGPDRDTGRDGDSDRDRDGSGDRDRDGSGDRDRDGSGDRDGRGSGGRPGTFVPLRSDDIRPDPSARPAARGDRAGSGTATATAPGAGTGSRTGPEAGSAGAGEARAAASAPGKASGTGTGVGGDAEVTAAVAPPSLTEAERTRQQPVPPLPPLDLLAELTNTPPPPETPLRTLARRVKIWTPLVILLVIVFATVQLLRPLPEPSLALSAGPAYTFEGGALKMPWPTEGQGAVEVEGVGVIGTYGPQKPAPTASVAKAMTAYVILRDHPIKDKDAGPKLVIDQVTEDQASNPDWSTAPVEKGQEYTQGELLQLLMVRSANNVAHFLARWDAGSEEAFIKKMNDAAKDLGMTETTYTDASGFDKGTVSTPKDQLKLAKAVMRFDAFREIVDMPNVNLPQIGRQLENGNTILLKDGVNGIKTGTSTPAGGNLLWSANTVVDGEVRRVLGVVMNVKSGATLSEKTKLAVETYSYGLIRSAQDGVVSAVAVKKGDVVGYVDDGLGGRTPVVAAKDLKPVGWAGLEVELKLTAGEDGKGGLPRTAAAGTVVGELSAGSGTGRVSVPVELGQPLDEPGFGARLTRIG